MPNGVLGKNGAAVEVVKHGNTLPTRRVVVPMAASLPLASNKFAWRQYWRVQLRRRGFRNSGRWSCSTCRNGVVTLLAVRQSQSHIVLVERMRRNSSGAGDLEVLHVMLPWKVVWLLVLGESFVCCLCRVP